MTRDQIIAVLRANRAALQARGVKHLAIFGSRARGDATPESDLDVLLDIDPERRKFTLIDLAGINILITHLSGIETYAVERRMAARNMKFAKRIADDIIEIF